MSFPIFSKLLGVELSEVSLTEKLIATLGGGLSILVLIAVSSWVLPPTAALPVITSMGASAVLLFAVPHGPLSQPWPVLLGHGISAFIGVTCAICIPQPMLAAAAAVGLAIGAMHQFKCIHPPGGATALAAVIGGPAIHQMGYGFVLCPVAVNAVAMVLLAVVINGAFKWRRYPAILSQPVQPATSDDETTPPTHEDVVSALRSLDSFVDISEEDLLRLTHILSHRNETARTSPIER